ncbi:hypothetical protein GHT06_017119 [Daphnia sinensis]|uniref:Uncharacterized protein n=1 Tax=Daphnia sinensis TaxID=1820382 RepID=A0AAD5PUN1_9CRUS|nr:hypothetical protein GHT06_005243 [Daphnia sinensis]KAI9557294.1 hypothetical protein GHT06_017119 [Daphnia sinensis]
MGGHIYFMGKRFLNCENFYDLNGLHSVTLGIVVVNRLSEVLEDMKISLIPNSISNIKNFGIMSNEL